MIKVLYKYITYIGEKSEIYVNPRRRIYCFERDKTQVVGFKSGEIHPKDALELSRKFFRGEKIFLCE